MNFTEENRPILPGLNVVESCVLSEDDSDDLQSSSAAAWLAK